MLLFVNAFLLAMTVQFLVGYTWFKKATSLQHRSIPATQITRLYLLLLRYLQFQSCMETKHVQK